MRAFNINFRIIIIIIIFAETRTLPNFLADAEIKIKTIYIYTSNHIRGKVGKQKTVRNVTCAFYQLRLREGRLPLLLRGLTHHSSYLNMTITTQLYTFLQTFSNNICINQCKGHMAATNRSLHLHLCAK